MPYYGIPTETAGDSLAAAWDPVGFGFQQARHHRATTPTVAFRRVVCTDWGLITDRPYLGDLGTARAWGVEHLSPEDRMLRVIEAGADQFGGEDCTEVLLALVRSRG